MNEALGLPAEIRNDEELEELLSTPTPEVIEVFRRLEGDLLILGVAGKMGPTLARMAQRAAEAAGVRRRIMGVARFSDSEVQMKLLRQGIETITCDLLNQDSLQRLPSAPNVIYMAARKFGSTGEEWQTWAMNAYLPGLVAERFQSSRIVAFSTGNVYPFVPVAAGGSREEDEVAPVGEYAQSCLGRERMFEYGSHRYGTPCTLLRLNYAVELRYGVLVDVALKVMQEQEIDLRMGYVNVIWQGDANAYALRALEDCQSPPEILNVTGAEVISIRTVAEEFGRRLGKEPRFINREDATALLNRAEKCFQRYGNPRVNPEEMIGWIVRWLKQGGRVYNKPTKYEVRSGKF